jgi:hypothetical protein
MPPRDFESRKAEVKRAGRFFVDAIFGEPGDFKRSVRDAIDEEEEREEIARPLPRVEVVATSRTAPSTTLATTPAQLPPSTIRCADCGREQSIPATFGRADVERLGWRRVERAWRCSLCAE